jgi:protein-S-isoprenylcysteine O-methyltransferase Ste14
MALKTGRVAYGFLFCAVLPALLVLWAHAARDIVHLPVYGSPRLGMGIAAAGAVLIAAGMAALRFYGGGLPMNAFPPPRLVTSGIYALFPHPIYTGFTLACFGIAMAARSASGLWLVAPVAGLGCAALVYGYEQPDLAHRFGGEALKALRVIPPSTVERPSSFDAVRFNLLVVIPWLALYEIVATLGVTPRSVDTRLAFEARLPVWTWTEPVYASTYLVAICRRFSRAREALSAR